MFLCIVFENESIPFILEDSEQECIRAINKAKELGCVFNKNNYIVEEDRIILHSNSLEKTEKQLKKMKRLYCYNDKVIFQTDARYKDEIEPTRNLLAYERGINPQSICVVEI